MKQQDMDKDPLQEAPKDQEIAFEAAFARLEHILEKMNKGTISLDESLKLYEEADRLINLCSTRLTSAEKKIEVLIKNRAGDLTISSDGKPKKEDFSSFNSLNPKV